MQQLIIHTDGGARGNPGPAATGFVIYDQNKVVLAEGGKYLGEATNNTAEYQAVIHALEYLEREKTPSGTELDFYLDSNLVVQQLKGNFKIKQPHLAQHAQAIHRLISQNQFIARFHHVRREKNHAADAKVNQILDAHQDE